MFVVTCSTATSAAWRMRSTCDAHTLPIHPTLSLQGSPIILANVSGSLPFPWQWINVALYDNDLTITTTRKIFWTGEERGAGQAGQGGIAAGRMRGDRQTRGGRQRWVNRRTTGGNRRSQGDRQTMGEQTTSRGQTGVGRQAGEAGTDGCGEIG